MEGHEEERWRGRVVSFLNLCVLTEVHRVNSIIVILYVQLPYLFLLHPLHPNPNSITRSSLLLGHFLESIWDPLHLLEREDFGNDFSHNEGKGDGSIFARIARVGQVVADEPTVSFRNLTRRWEKKRSTPHTTIKFGREKVYLNHPLLRVFSPIILLLHPRTGRYTSEHEIPLHAHDALHGAVATILGHRVLDLDDVADAYAATASVTFGHQDAVAAHGECGHHGWAHGALDGEQVRVDEVHARAEFESRERDGGEGVQGGDATHWGLEEMGRRMGMTGLVGG